MVEDLFEWEGATLARQNLVRHATAEGIPACSECLSSFKSFAVSAHTHKSNLGIRTVWAGLSLLSFPRRLDTGSLWLSQKCFRPKPSRSWPETLKVMLAAPSLSPCPGRLGLMAAAHFRENCCFASLRLEGPNSAETRLGDLGDFLRVPDGCQI